MAVVGDVIVDPKPIRVHTQKRRIHLGSRLCERGQALEKANSISPDAESVVLFHDTVYRFISRRMGARCRVSRRYAGYFYEHSKSRGLKYKVDTLDAN